jgi:hypothetical protein
MRKKLLASAAAGIGAVLMAVTPVGATVLVNETRVPLTDAVVVPCANGGAGEQVDVAAVLHVLASATINGNTVSADVHFDIKGTGIGEVTGDSYQVSEVATIRLSGSLQIGQLTATLPQTINVIGLGSAPNFKQRALGQFTVNADGTVTVEFQTLEATCR